MSSFSFFIYDYESFGTNPRTARPAQFAGIRTDEHFNIISDPIVCYCKPTNDYLPSPEAVLVTGITPQQCEREGLSEPEFAERILQEFSRPNTCITGYNNIRYDDEITRYLFYRNFMPPYDYSWQNDNSRWDLIDIVRACYALRPEGIQWAYDADGIPGFSLTDLTQANGIEHTNAHDALADVYATLHLAKLIQEKQPQLFHYFFDRRKKQKMLPLIDVKNMTPLVHVSGRFGNARGNTAIVVPLAWHPTNQNAVIVCDLGADLDDLLTRNADELRKNLYTKYTQLQEQGILPVPLKCVHINKCPILAPLKTLPQENEQKLGIDRERCLSNLARLQKSPDISAIREKVQRIFDKNKDSREVTPNANDDNVETQLYDDFFSWEDKDNMETLRKLPAEALAKHQLIFQDERISELLFHYRAKHHFTSLTDTEQIKWQKYRRHKLKRERETFEQDMQTLTAQHQNNPEKLALLQQVRAYSDQLFKDL